LWFPQPAVSVSVRGCQLPLHPAGIERRNSFATLIWNLVRAIIALIRKGATTGSFKGSFMGSFSKRKFSPTAVLEFFSRPRPGPLERLEIVLKDKQAARQSLVRRLDTAEMFVSDKRQAGERLALDGASDEALGLAEAATRAAEDRARTLRAALAQLDEQIAETERELRTAVEQRYRDTVADWLEARAAAIARAAPGYDASSSALIEAVTKSAAALPEASGLAADLEAMRVEVRTSVELISTELRSAATRTRLGEARIAFRASPDAPFSPELGHAAISASAEAAASIIARNAIRSVLRASPTAAGSVEQADAGDKPESESKAALEQADSASKSDAKAIKHHAAA
jgi:hypothetical protein